MMPQTVFQTDDRVRHTAKPEWGAGTVLSAQPATHDGEPCQRVTVRFDQAGKKTLSTAFARLALLDRAEGEPPGSVPSRPGPRRGAGPGADARKPGRPDPVSADVLRERLASLPESVADPFRSLEERLAETLGLYRFSAGDRTLLDWATIQTGVRDTLSTLTRHDLEQQFEVFRIRLDRHLRDLLENARRAGVDLRAMLADAPPGAQHALRRINHTR